MTIAFWLSRSTKMTALDVEQRPVGRSVLAQAHLLDHDGDRVRQLVAHAFERGLPDQLADHVLLGLVGELALGVERGPVGQQPDEQVGEQLDLVAADRRHRDDLGEVGELVDREQLLGELVCGRPGRSW